MSSFLTITVGLSEGATRQREVTNNRLMHQNFHIECIYPTRTKMKIIIILETADGELISNSTLLIETT
jgi:hypothetical protein